MASFLTSADYGVPPYDIPANTLKENSFNAFLLNVQEPILRRLLGNTLYDLLVAQINVLPLPDATQQKWKDLVNGSNYQLEADGIVYRWVGIKEMLKPYEY